MKLLKIMPILRTSFFLGRAKTRLTWKIAAKTHLLVPNPAIRTNDQKFTTKVGTFGVNFPNFEGRTFCNFSLFSSFSLWGRGSLAL